MIKEFEWLMNDGRMHGLMTYIYTCNATIKKRGGFIVLKNIYGTLRILLMYGANFENLN